MKKLMIVVFLLMAGFAPNIFAQVVETCTGGWGNDYGNMTCHVPDCNVTANPSLGCSGVVPPAGNGDAYACYPTTGSAQTSANKLCNSLTPPTATCWDTNAVGMTAWCDSPSSGVNTPGTNRVALTDQADNEPLSCKPLQTAFVTKFCEVVKQ